MFSILARTLNSPGSEFANISEKKVFANISESTVLVPKMLKKQPIRDWCIQSLNMEVRSGTPIHKAFRMDKKRFKTVQLGL